MQREIDMAPPPEDTLQLVRMRCGGWIVIFDGECQVACSNLRDLTRWLSENLGPLEELEAEAIKMPTVLDAARSDQRPIWRIFSGGKTE